MSASVARRDADAGLVPAPRRVAGEALQAPQSPDGFLRLAALRPGEEVRNPTVPVDTGASGAGHGAEPFRDTGKNARAGTYAHIHARFVGEKKAEKVAIFIF